MYVRQGPSIAEYPSQSYGLIPMRPWKQGNISAHRVKTKIVSRSNSMNSESARLILAPILLMSLLWPWMGPSTIPSLLICSKISPVPGAMTPVAWCSSSGNSQNSQEISLPFTHHLSQHCLRVYFWKKLYARSGWMENKLILSQPCFKD